MSKINLNNYEAFVIDYFDGKLKGEEAHALKTFLLMHPELDLNLDEEPILLENETVNYEGKQSLKANFNNDLVIGFLEGKLNKDENNIAESLLLNNTLFKKELDLYKHTIAVPDAQVVFENKNLLKRKGKTIVFSTAFYMRIAAAVILLAGLWMLTSTLLINDKTIAPEIAKVENKTIVTPQNKTTIKENNSTLIEPVQEKNNFASTSKKKKENTPEVKTNTPEVITNEQEPEKLYATNNATTNTVQEIKVTEVTNNTLNKTNNETVKPKYMIEVVEEGDELLASNNTPQKGKLWNLATKALNKLNKNGVNKVNASEKNNQLFIGALTISKVD